MRLRIKVVYERLSAKSGLFGDARKRVAAMNVHEWDRIVSRYFYLKRKRSLTVAESREMQQLAIPVQEMEHEWTANFARIKAVHER